MFPSKYPLLYLLHVLLVGGTCFAAVVMGFIYGQPLAALSVMALQYIPEFPLIPEQMPVPERDSAIGFGLPPSYDDQED